MNDTEETTLGGILEQDREQLLGAMKAAPAPEQAGAAAGSALNRALMQYNEQCGSLRQRAAASAMVETLQSALGLLSAGGEPRIWTREGERAKRPFRFSLLLLPAAGLALHIAAFLLLLRNAGGPILSGALLLAGMAADWLGALRFAAAARPPEPERRAEAVMDWEQVYEALHTSALVMDRNLKELAEAEPARPQGAAEGPDPALLELLGSLLEASRSANGDFALEQLRGVSAYLRAQGIEAVDCGPESAAFFDILPGVERMTLRPALVRDGRLLLRGLAAGGD